MTATVQADSASKVLSLLDQAGDGFITGAALGEELGISRAGVWKRIENLRQAGYGIEARPRRGYRLAGSPDVLTATRVGAGLDTAVIGRHIHHVVETPTTMTLAAELAADGAPDGTVVVAERQGAGRGRLGRAWSTAPGRGIWTTIILRPELSPMELAPLTLLTAVGVADGIRDATGLDPQIKWPNDILLDGRKTVGILTELVAEQDVVRYVLVGIGINVLQSREEFPPELREIATSINQERAEPIGRVEVFQAVLRRLDAEYRAAIDHGFDDVLERWKAQSVTLGSRVTVDSSAGAFTGLAMDITPQGALIVNRDNGERTTVVSGDVTLVRG